MHLRRNTKLSIFNSIFAGYVTGLFIDGTATQANATNGSLNVRNSILAGCKDFFAADFDSTYFVTAEFENVNMSENTDLEITDPFNLESPDFLPRSGSPVLTASSWYEEIPSAVGEITDNKISATVYPNPFTGSARLSIDLESESQVSVKVYDLTGTLISTLVNEIRGIGNHEFTITIPQKGVYFADIAVNKNRQVVKLVAR